MLNKKEVPNSKRTKPKKLEKKRQSQMRGMCQRVPMCASALSACCAFDRTRRPISSPPLPCSSRHCHSFPSSDNSPPLSSPANGHSLSSPVNGHSLSSPANGHSLSSPANGHSLSSPVNGHSLPSPVNGHSLSSSANGHSLSSSVSGSSVRSPPLSSGGRCDVNALLAYNKQWAAAVTRADPDYFARHASQQRPPYLWIGCSDSRVPPNEILGLRPGELFVHRNIANIVSPRDPNALSVLHYAVACLRVECVIVAGHFACGGVAAALSGECVGFADKWIRHVSAVRRAAAPRLESEVPAARRHDALCELNVIAQVAHVMDTRVVQSAWEEAQGELQVHGWIYGVADGKVRPLLKVKRGDNAEKIIEEAEEEVFRRYGES